jgi:hypothetical protein
MKTRLMLLGLLLSASVAAVAGAPGVEGQWMVTITHETETITGVAFLKQTDNKVTGSIGANEQNQHPLDGIMEGNHLTLTTHPRPGATAAFAKCSLTLEGEKMTGMTEGGDLVQPATILLVRPKQ